MHANLITSTQSLLTAQLRPKYVVRIEERTYITNEVDEAAAPHPRIPDIQVRTRRNWAQSTDVSATGIQEIELADPIITTTWFEEEISETFLKILDCDNREVVAVLEFLSPTNKVPGSAGRESFERKRREVMNSQSHWLEVDLLRGGRTVFVPPATGSFEYLVHVSRSQDRPSDYLYPISIKSRLPVIRVPLKEGDPAGYIDLQAVLDAVYDRAGYDLEIDYRSDAPVPLEQSLTDWVDQRLKLMAAR